MTMFFHCGLGKTLSLWLDYVTMWSSMEVMRGLGESGELPSAEMPKRGDSCHSFRRALRLKQFEC